MKMEMKKNREITEVKVKYSDGEEKTTKKCLIVDLNELKREENLVKIRYDLVNVSGQDLDVLVWAMVDLGLKMGVFDKKGEKKDESNKSTETD